MPLNILPMNTFCTPAAFHRSIRKIPRSVLFNS
jgi:hypothetical protein